MYADDILLGLLALTVSALQHLLNVCQSELQYLDMAINAKNMSAPGLVRDINSHVVICFPLMVVRLSDVRMLGILGFM